MIARTLAALVPLAILAAAGAEVGLAARAFLPGEALVEASGWAGAALGLVAWKASGPMDILEPQPSIAERKPI